ncbi:MAG: hypothetical protein HDT13_01220 [Butyrivibrio sp.]|nr:hypothetical protein [Butyrivibrio sp.]
MKRILIVFIVILIAVTGCAKSSKPSDINSGGVLTSKESELANEDMKPDETEMADTPKDMKSIKIKGDLWLKNPDSIYTEDAEGIHAYTFSDGTFCEQALEKGLCDLGGDSNIVLYYYYSDEGIVAISEFENTSHTVYTIDDNTLLLVDDGGWAKKIYIINIDSMKGEEISFNFEASNHGALIDVRVSPDHNRGILTLEEKDAKCIYYLADFKSGEVKSLDELYDVPVYQSDNGTETLTSEFEFADNNTIIASIKSEESFELIKYQINECKTEIIEPFDGHMNDMVTGESYSVVRYNDTIATIINNLDGNKQNIDLYVDGYTQTYEILNHKYALLMNRSVEEFCIVNLESGKYLEEDMGGNVFSFIITEDGKLVRYEAEDGIITYYLTDYSMP